MNYENALLQTIDDNNDSLIGEIEILLKQPPLISMDLLQSKIVMFAKENHVVIALETLQQLIKKYRNATLNDLKNIGQFRKSEIKNLLQKELSDNKSLLEIDDERYQQIDNDFINQLLGNINNNINSIIVPKILSLVNKTDNNKDNNIPIFVSMTEQYLKGDYPEYILEQLKKLVYTKNCTLNNRFKDQESRKKFIEKNSHLLEKKED